MDLSMISIPLVGELKENGLPLPEDYNYWKSRNDRTFFIDYEIGEDYPDGSIDMRLVELGKVIIQMNMDEKDIPVEELKPIYIYIYSYGGRTDMGLMFADICISSRIPIITIGMGAVMSCGFLIFLAGHKRYAFDHCQMLVHQGFATIQGSAQEVEAAQKNYKKQLDSVKDYILKRTNIDEKVYNRNKNKDWYLSQEEFVNYKVVDKIIESFDDIK